MISMTESMRFDLVAGKANQSRWLMRLYMQRIKEAVEIAATQVSRSLFWVLIHKDELIQQGYVLAARLRGGYRPEVARSVTFKNWLVCRLVGALKDWLHKNLYAKRQVTIVSAVVLPESAAEDPDLAQVDARDSWNAMRSRLSDGAKKCLDLYERDGLDPEKIADVCDVSPHTVRRHLQAARSSFLDECRKE